MSEHVSPPGCCHRTQHVNTGQNHAYIYIYMSASINRVQRLHTIRQNSVAKASYTEHNPRGERHGGLWTRGEFAESSFQERGQEVGRSIPPHPPPFPPSPPRQKEWCGIKNYKNGNFC